jgi:protocatechuate 3,4-dioxygenase beta subunit
VKRRAFFGLSALLASTSLQAFRGNDISPWLLEEDTKNPEDLPVAPQIKTQFCVLTPEQTEGPFFFRSPVRRNIKERQPGLALNLTLMIVDINSCLPVPGAIVEVWHCNHRGEYSGFNERHRTDQDQYRRGTFLRGAQVTDVNGIVKFHTVFPGWYPSRVTHIHLKVHHAETTFLTTQLYFSDHLVNKIYSNHSVYKANGNSPHSLKHDFVFGYQSNRQGLILETRLAQNGLSAEGKLGISK